jgi:predicted nucleotidyltransferase
MTLARLTARKLIPSEVQVLIEHIVQDLSGLPGLVALILFGSAASGEMTEASDIDVVAVFDSTERAHAMGKTIHGQRKRATWPMDILSVDRETFKAKSQVGGVYYVAYREGRAIWGEMP